MFPAFRAVAAQAAWLLLVSGGLWQEQAGASRFALAIVADRTGKAVVDVSADDFVVEEAGASREILDVRVADYPVAIVVDTGRAARDDFEFIRAAVARLLERLGPRPIAIVTTSPEPEVVATFEDERETVVSKLKALDSGDADSQPLRSASRAAETIRATGTLFAAIIVVTATPAEVSGAAAEPLLPAIIDSAAVVHVVARAAEGTGSGTPGPFLRALAQQMHGDFTTIYAAPSYQPAIDRLVTRLTTELMIEYIVPVGSKPRDVKIGVRIPGARVRGLGVAPRD